MKKQTKKTTKKTLAKKNNKSVSIFSKKKKESNNSIKIAFYIIFIIVVLLILYFVNFKKPKTATPTNDEVVISEMLNGDAVANDSSNGYSLKLPSSFKVFRQSKANTSGPATILSILSYFGKDAVFNEAIVEDLKSEHEAFHIGTCVNQIKEILSTLRIKYWTNENYKEIPSLKNESVGLKLIEKTIGEGYPVMVGWNKNPGQWSIVVGYDNKGTEGTEDDIITMVNTDSEPHTDTYSKVSANEFNNKWTFNNVFKEEPSAQELNDKCFIIINKN